MNIKKNNLVFNEKHRKSCIFRLEQEEGVICGDIELKRYIIKYYKKPFGPSNNNTVLMDESYRDYIPQVSNLKNEMLVITPFLRMRYGRQFCRHNTARRPNGFPPVFYQVF
jgi:hypothetical protein